MGGTAMKEKDMITDERAKQLEELSLDVGSAAMQAMNGMDLTLQEGLTVLSMAVSTIIGITAKLAGTDEEEMIECFCESLKFEEK